MGFLDKVKETAKDADEKLGDRIDIDKLESKIRDEKRNIEKIVKEIGDKCVENARAGKDTTLADVQQQVSQIEESEKRIQELQAQIDEIKAKKSS
jgi:hypothetical protein